MGKRPYGRTIYVNGVEASPQDILSSFEKKKGRQKEKLLIEFSDMTVCWGNDNNLDSINHVQMKTLNLFKIFLGNFMQSLK